MAKSWRGNVGVYYRDDLKRTYSTQMTRSSTGTPVTTTTLRSGLTTTTTRSDGTTTLLVSTTTRALNGDMVSSTSADSDGNTATDETTSYAYSYPGDSGHPSGEGVKTTVTMPDGSTSIRRTYLDGRVKSVTGTAVADMDYTYGTHNLAAAGSPAPAGAGGETTTVSYGGTSQSTTNFTDALGRTFKVQYDTGVNSTMSYNPPTASA